ncbi:GHKL domain-containing protein [Nostoc sp. FACHB-87]|uniref:sensor histidine kinase n=1 Tax=Nostocaceae TaxID=1162 RepID=UPI001683D099|nr:GHKL domain-containing protein [Nostoc sp. FACHB-87]MBD2478742.1 GHKL domain-containing protein [Anabaena sp. FACHB-83]MBD2489260.1 GHKL domain-containing protein [Aulosira sp. FACHB-615]
MQVEHFFNFFLSQNFIPHGHCYLWQPKLVWLHILSDFIISISYYSIPLMLVYFINKREDVPFKNIFVLFSAFIISCGTTHLMEILTLWHPYYWLSGTIKALTAIISFYTALTLIPLVPQALTLPSPAQLEQANQALQVEISERKLVENELRQYKERLEELVEQRTAELATANKQLQTEIVQRQKSQERMGELLQELKNTNQELNDFAYIVSHDLKAPLRGIGLLSEWLINDYGDKFDEEGKDLINKIILRVKKLQNLIDSILEYSRIGRIREEKREVNLQYLVSDVIEILEPSKNIQIEVSDNLPIIYCEKTKMQQVFQNLLSNAIKFLGKPQGKIIIACQEVADYWQISVTDNGIGIEEKYFTKIFQIFQKLSSTEDPTSTGIGLSIVKKIVEMYGGSTWVESTFNQGSTFFFTIKKTLQIQPVQPVSTDVGVLLDM